MKDNRFYIKRWALRWIEGSVISYMRGATPLNILMGRIRKCLKDYDVDMREIDALLTSIENNPIFLPLLTKNENKFLLGQLRDALKLSKKKKEAI
ncbi:MAG: hypothetical protein NDF55_00070 [archaeon GB-1867-005]|nr:hypothetical protein [Candidatus Culexmicrobium cathedralense]